MKYKLICADIDGTLLDDEKKLLPQVKQSLREAAGQGVKIALASGRMPAGVDMVEQELGVPCIKICSAGTCILWEDRCISKEYILPDTMESIYLEIAKKKNIPLWIFKQREWFVTDIDRYVEREMEIIRYQPEVVEVEYLAERWRREKTGPNKLHIAAEPERIHAIYETMKEQKGWDIDLARSSDVFLEIFPKGITKGTALAAVCHMLGITLEDTIAFGDHELDIPMIEAAGFGVAMGNAIDELKAKADFVTKTNKEAGVAYALEALLKS